MAAVWSDNKLFSPTWSALVSWMLSRREFFYAARVACDEGKVSKIAKNEGSRINDEITARTCRLIGVDGSQLGLFGVADAQRIADEQGLDLVEIAPNAEPPVCKVMDYRKYKYEQDRKAKAARKKQVRVEVKEMKFRPKIDVGDYTTKKNNVLERLAEDLKPYATVESQPKMEGRNMHMLVAPIKGAFDEKDEEGDVEIEKEN